MLAIADFQGHMLQLNPTWEKVLGYTEEELKATTGFDLVHPQDHPEMCDKMKRLQNNETVYFEGRYRRKDGTYRWLGWTAAPFVVEKLIYIFARDITERKGSEDEIRALNQQLNRRVSELTEINKELEAFSYSISHDLRAPLRAMQGFAHTLLHEYGTRLDDDGREFAKRIVNSSMYMDTLLHDLLDYSRLTRCELECAPVMLEGVLNEIIAQTEKGAGERKPVIEIKRPMEPVWAHLPTVRQILSNLISNGLKFVSKEKVPTLKIHTQRNGDVVRIWIEDNGIGIPDEHHSRIFGLFERLHTNREYPGTGVGLALVRKGIERMGGRVGLESKLNEGSRFWFELPSVESAERLVA